jgi:Tfp pilus assembly protein PilV
MKPNNNIGITLIELIVSIILLGMVVVSFFSIDLFSRQQFLATDKRAKLQNEAVYVLSHISKQLTRAIGDVNNLPVNITPSSGITSVIRATIDATPDGMLDFSNDANISYCYNSVGCNHAAVAYSIYFNSNISAASVPAAEILASHVRSFYATQSGNCVSVNIVTCWDPAESSQPCGSLDNPAINITNSVSMPSVSVQ